MLEFNADSELFKYFHILHFNSFKLLIISLVLMESNTAETFDFDEIQQIIVNTFQNDWLHNSKE